MSTHPEHEAIVALWHEDVPVSEVIASFDLTVEQLADVLDEEGLAVTVDDLFDDLDAEA